MNAIILYFCSDGRGKSPCQGAQTAIHFLPKTDIHHMDQPQASPKIPAYRTRLKAERANAIYVQILDKLTREKLYRDPTYTSIQLAKDLHTNTRYISAAVALGFNGNYSALVNSLRLRDACKMLRSPRYARLTVEEIGLLSGFSSRQAFYLAFHRVYECTPKEYREKT